jgi:hypothetical protein
VLIRLDAILFVATMLLIADIRVPTFDIETHCRDVARRAAPIGDAQVCTREEQDARDQLIRQWAKFAAADKRRCLELSTMGEATYTELLTCLELATEARNLRERERKTTGQGGP